MTTTSHTTTAGRLAQVLEGGLRGRTPERIAREVPGFTPDKVTRTLTVHGHPRVAEMRASREYLLTLASDEEVTYKLPSAVSSPAEGEPPARHEPPAEATAAAAERPPAPATPPAGSQPGDEQPAAAAVTESDDTEDEGLDQVVDDVRTALYYAGRLAGSIRIGFLGHGSPELDDDGLWHCPEDGCRHAASDPLPVRIHQAVRHG